MAFDFGDALGTLAGIGKTLQGPVALGLGFMQNRRRMPLPPGYEEALQASQRSSQLAQSLDPSSAYFQKLAGEEEGRIRRDFVEALRQAQVEQRRARASGRGGYINPERRDEAMASATANAFTQAQEQARVNARNYIMSQIQANNVAAGGFSRMLVPGMINQGQNQQRGANVNELIVRALGGFGGNQPAQKKTDNKAMLGSTGGMSLGGAASMFGGDNNNMFDWAS